MTVLSGIRVIELGGMGPGPFCGMMLGDMGADVILVDRRLAKNVDPPSDVTNRNKRSIFLDLKQPAGQDALLQLVDAADMLIDPYRPGVTERLGIGPETCLERNPRLIYGRMTGWGQDGPLAKSAGRDLNYIAITGVLDSIGTIEAPVPPLNLIGDGAGGLYLLAGLLAAYSHALKTGHGQVIDAAMCDGAANIMSGIFGYRNEGRWQPGRGANFLDGSRPEYAVYRCADDQFISITPFEPRFFRELFVSIGIDLGELPDEPAGLQAVRKRLAGIFASRTRDEWSKLLEGTDCGFAPVLSIDEAPKHPHLVARDTFISIDGVVQPAPAPRFSKTASNLRSAAPIPGNDTTECLREWGVSETTIAKLGNQFLASEV